MSISADYFVELGQERILSMDLDSLRASYQKKAKQVHPDGGGDESDLIA